jgi:sugar phosphate isomerase/epimerase
MPGLHLGINSCFAVKRWPEPERWVSVIAEDLGLDCCQFSFDLVDPLLDEAALLAYADEVRASAAAHGLFVHSTFTGLAAYSWSQLLHPDARLRAAAMRWYERAIDFTARLQAWGTGGYLGALSVQDAANPERRALLLAELKTRLAALTRYAAARGLRFLLFENMAVVREWGYSLEEAYEISALQSTGGLPLLLCLDVGHPCALRTGTASDDYRAWLAYPWPHTPVIHLQQTERGSDHHWPFTAEYNRRGLVRAGEVLTALRGRSEEDVYLFLEPIHPFEADDALVLAELRESVAYWRAALQELERGQPGQ